MYYDCATVLLVLFEIQIGNTVIEIPGWLKATIGFSLPVMANLFGGRAGRRSIHSDRSMGVRGVAGLHPLADDVDDHLAAMS